MTSPERPPAVVYLSEPPEGGALAETMGESATYQLTVRGYHVYRPVSAWRYAEAPDGTRPNNINRHALGLADAMVAVLTSAFTGSIAVPMEIEAALGLGTPVVVLTGPSTGELLYAQRGLTIVTDVTALADAVDQALAEAPPVDRTASFGIHPRSQAPHPAKRLALYSVDNTYLPASSTTVVETGTNLEPGQWGVVVARNAGLATRELWVLASTTDDTGGPVALVVHNLGRQAQRIHMGEHLADLLVYSAT